jgi:hypothetical protein
MSASCALSLWSSSAFSNTLFMEVICKRKTVSQVRGREGNKWNAEKGKGVGVKKEKQQGGRVACFLGGGVGTYQLYFLLCRLCDQRE